MDRTLLFSLLYTLSDRVLNMPIKFFDVDVAMDSDVFYHALGHLLFCNETALGLGLPPPKLFSDILFIMHFHKF